MRKEKLYTVKLTKSQVEFLNGSLRIAKIFSRDELFTTQIMDIIKRFKNKKLC